MDQNKEKHQPKRAKGATLGLKTRGKVILAVVVLALLLGGYTALCAAVNTEQILPKTTANGVALSGMTGEEASAALEADFETRYSDSQITVTANGEDYTVAVGDALTMDTEATAQDALTQQPFFARGACLVEAYLFGSHRTVLPTVGDSAALAQAVEDSGLLDINTTVQTSYEVKDGQLVFTMGVTGSSVDEAGLLEQLTAAVAAGDYDTAIDCPMITGAVEAVDVDAVYEALYVDAANATLDPDNDYAIVASVTGVSFDQDTVQAALDAAAEGETVAIDLDYQEPEVTTQKLEDNLFVDYLGSYTTKVSGTSNRISNVKLAAEKISGTILLSGQVFSYNGTVGERTAENGFKEAAAYLNGDTVQELGGGICQVSSTLYAATLYANLEIVERHNHTYASSYIDLGLDATVSWEGPDYQFCNNTSYPIKIVADYSDGYVSVTLLGTKTNDNYVNIVSETRDTISYSTIEKDDSSQYVGESTVTQKGENDYKVQTYRQIYDSDGNLLSETEEAYSSYSKHDEIVYVGTKKKKNSKKSSKKSSSSSSSNSSSSDSDSTSSDSTSSDSTSSDSTSSNSSSGSSTTEDSTTTASSD
ncbi:MAG: VanW family protein [Clostridiales bacterium]|nr:VanW family protein [Clostridiales bacterium]